MKYLFRLTTTLHTFLYRLTGGRTGSQMRGFKVLLLTTTGRKTGKQRTTPLGYFEAEGGYVIIASNGGLPQNPAWYYNIKSIPQVNIQVKDRRLTVNGEVADPATRARLWQQLMREAPAYGDYEKSTDRVIPLVILRPSA